MKENQLITQLLCNASAVIFNLNIKILMKNSQDQSTKRQVKFKNSKFVITTFLIKTFLKLWD